MKNIFKYIAGVLVAGFAMTSCSPEDFTGANGNIPQASDYTDNFKVTVDQTTNYANFEFTSAPGVSPIWIIALIKPHMAFPNIIVKKVHIQ